MKKILILHGLTSSNKSRKILKIQEKLGLECIIPNLPQHGDNEDKFDIKEILIQLENILEEMKDAEKKYLVGRSFGGYLALLLVKRFPNFFDKICLMSPALNMEEVMKHLINEKIIGENGEFETKIYAPPEHFRSFDKEIKNLKLNIPTLIIHGNSDPVAKIDQVREFTNKNKKIELKIFPVGHYYEDKEKEIIKNTVEWLND